jgi:hypothetical protein
VPRSLRAPPVRSSAQCTCSTTPDCAAREECTSGVCGPHETNLGCTPGCENGLGCVNDTCVTCTSFEDCNTIPYDGPELTGRTCVDGVCTSCNANS